MARKVPLPSDLNSITATPLSELVGWLITTAAYTGCCIVTWKRCFHSNRRISASSCTWSTFNHLFSPSSVFFNQCNEEKKNFVRFRDDPMTTKEIVCACPYRCVTIYFSWPKDRRASGVMAVRKTYTGSALSTLSGITLYLLYSAARIAPLFRPDKKLEIVYP